MSRLLVNIQYQVHQLLIVSKRIQESRSKGFTVLLVQGLTQIVNDQSELEKFGSILLKLTKNGNTKYVVILPTGKTIILN